MIALVVLVFGLLGGSAMMGGGMMGGRGGYGILMMVFWVIVIGGIISLLVWLFQQGSPGGTPAAPGGDRALDILRQRYAGGEITREQFEQMRRDLEGK